MDTNDTTIDNIFEVRNLGRFETQWKQIAKRAQRTGVEIGYRILADEMRPVPCHCNTCDLVARIHAGYTERVVTVEVWGETPKFAGYELVGVVVDLDEAIRQVRGVPGQDLPDSLWLTDDHCDHCNANVRRNSVIVLRNEQGELVQVGTSCVKDFLGGYSPADVAWMSTWLPELAAGSDEEGGWGGGGELFYGRLDVLTTTLALIETHGWVSKGQAYDSDGRRTATANRCANLLSPPPRTERDRAKWKKDWAEIQERDASGDAALINSAIEWLINLDARGNDYLMNLKSLGMKAAWTAKDLGYACSIVSSYLREVTKQEERKAREVVATAPVETGRIVIEGQVIQEATKENDFGIRYVMTVFDDRGFKVWGTQPKAISNDIKVGVRVRFTATIERSDSDESFGFFSRPAKAEVL